MVWGRKEPSGLGQYFPDGDYVGWANHLTAYFNEQMSDDEKAANRGRPTGYVLNVAQKFTHEIGAPRPHDPTLTPLQDHELPTEFRAETPMAAQLGSLIELTDRLFAIVERLQNITERLEPGKHLFWPIKMTTHMGASRRALRSGPRCRQRGRVCCISNRSMRPGSEGASGGSIWDRVMGNG